MVHHVRARSVGRGATLVHATLVAVVLLAFSSLAVDWGRVVVIRSELNQVAEAAARDGANNLTADPATARKAAIAVAALNRADGSAVELLSTDVELGDWDPETRAFRVLAGADAASADAVRVTARRTAARGNAVRLHLAQIIGQGSCDVEATAIATLGDENYAVIGLDSISMTGNATTSYWSSGGGGAAGRLGHVASNGDITLGGSTYVNGYVRPGVGRQVIGGAGRVGGSISPLKRPLRFPNGDAGVYATNNDNRNVPSQNINGTSFNLKSNASLALPGGNYYAGNVSIQGTLSFTGPATIYCFGDFSMAGQAVTSQGLPKNLTIVMCPGPTGTPPGSVTIGSSSALYARIYAPQSPVTLSGSGDIYGSVLGKSVTMTGTSGIHYDTALRARGGAVSLVY
jgi:Flp pilus assembly protein TadG